MRRSMRVVYDLYSYAMRRPKAKKYLRDRFRKNCDEMAKLIDLGIEQGEFRKVDSRKIATLLATAYEGMVTVNLLYDDQFSWQETADSLLDIYLTAITV